MNGIPSTRMSLLNFFNPSSISAWVRNLVDNLGWFNSLLNAFALVFSCSTTDAAESVMSCQLVVVVVCSASRFRDPGHKSTFNDDDTPGMDITFNNSGAINRAHFALVQKVESATSPSIADDAIIQEIDAIRRRFSKPSFTPDSVSCSPLRSRVVLLKSLEKIECRNWLLILLYGSYI